MKINGKFALIFFNLWLFSLVSLVAQETRGNPLLPVKTESPRDVMRSFINAMNDYKRGLDQNDEQLESRIQDAIRCLNLEDVNVLLRDDQGREAAIYLKEVMDRVIILDYSKIPNLEEIESKSKEHRVPVWRLRKTDIRVSRVSQGERTGEWLLSPNTVLNARNYYLKVKHMPYLKSTTQGAGFRPPWLEEKIPSWMREQFLMLSWWQWIGFCLSVLIGLLIKQTVKYLITLLKKLARRSRNEWDDLLVEAVASPVGYLAACLFWFVCLRMLNLEGIAMTVAMVLLKVIFSVVVVWLAYRLTEVMTEWLRKLSEKTESTLDDQLVPLFSRTLKIIVIVLGVLISIQNLGVNVLSLLAGLGIGGLAFALAAKDTVANFFGSLMILFDRPFQVGDWIKVNGEEGTVEEIGFRSTRIRTFYNSLVSIPNSEIANTNIDNMGARTFRRTMTTLGVTYDTDPQLLELFLEGIKNIIKANPSSRKDYYHVIFNGFGDSSLEILLYFFFKVPDWNQELLERQNVYLEILRLAKQLGIEFAFPTQTLHLESMPGKAPARKPTTVSDKKMRKLVKDFGPGGIKSSPQGLGYFTPPYDEQGGLSTAGGDGDRGD